MSHRFSPPVSLLKSYTFSLGTQLINSKFLPKHRLLLIEHETPVEPFRSKLFPSGNIFIKRDDQLDSYASGNKLRKLEFLFADILSRPNCKHIITAGSLHSNHCKAVAVLASKYRKQTHILLRTDRTKDDEQILQGNVLLNYLLGAKLYLIPKKANIQRDIEPRVKLLEEQLGGQDKCYSIPIGGSDTTGIFGYIDCFVKEILPIIDKFNLGHLVLPMSSGGTMEGLALANYFTGNRLRIHAFAVSDNKTYFKTHFKTILHQLELNHLTELVDNNQLVDICDSHVGLGYGRMTDEQIIFLRQVISETGILFDPVYTGKCLWGLAEELRNQRMITDGKNILVLHTGGLLGLMNPEYGQQWLKCNQSHSDPHIRDWMTLD
ncbi:unnamed protein product [Adineta ricciae]|uniref:Tryptophan synthase beta chain-like PALP domain-containing protein n=1 Tax=Adineta ricciae TaxID=249248 RepID=A0A814D5C7_ADIRI|nr:unnamed protein product [Adineta ricciae]CAF0953597.1 unnamed protein product [Adineta ricciae]